MQEIAERVIYEKLDDQNIKAVEYNKLKVRRIEEIVIEKANPNIDKKEEDDVIGESEKKLNKGDRVIGESVEAMKE